MVEAGLDRLVQHPGELVQDVGTKIAPGDVDPERQRQTGLQQPPLAEVDGLPQALRLVGELTLVDQEPGIRAA